MDFPKTRREVAFAVGNLALLAFAFVWVWVVGHRGLFVFDESIAFDGAWRVAQGQVPYRDFVMPFGPVTFALSGLMFRWLGVDFSVLVLTAALLSLLVTALSLRLLWVLTSGSRTATLLGGLLTAVWYQAPFGIPWMEQTAFAFDLVSLLLIVEGRTRAGTRWPWFASAGVAAAGAILSKQNAGGLFLLVTAGALSLPLRETPRVLVRSVAAYAAGIGGAAASFALWLVLYSEPATFLHYWGALSAAVGAARIDAWSLVGALFFQRLTSSALPLFWVSSLVGAGGLYLVTRAGSAAHARTHLALAAWSALALPQFHNLMQLTTNNEPPNNNAFAGVCAACAWALVSEAAGSATKVGAQSAAPLLPLQPALRALLVALAVLSSYSFVEGSVLAYRRSLHDFVGASFTRNLRHPRASRLKWGEPTHISPAFCALIGEQCNTSERTGEAVRDQELRRQDFDDIAADLTRRRQNFFVFPDATILYGLAGRPSPQPLLYFHPDQSFFRSEQAELDRKIVDSLRSHRVTLVVLERSSFMGTHRLLASFVCLNRWIETNFELVATYGNYRLLAASDTAESAGLPLPESCMQIAVSSARAR